MLLSSKVLLRGTKQDLIPAHPDADLSEAISMQKRYFTSDRWSLTCGFISFIFAFFLGCLSGSGFFIA